MIVARDLIAVTFQLSVGQVQDAPIGRALLESWGDSVATAPLVMNRAYEGDEPRQLAQDLGMKSAVPSKSNRRSKWDLDAELYMWRNEIERLSCRLKNYRRIFTKFEKLDVMFLAFLNFGLVVEMIGEGN